MSSIGQDVCSCESIPHFDREIKACRSQTLPIGRPCQRDDGILVFTEGVEGIPRESIPYLCCIINRSTCIGRCTSRGDMFAIGRPCYCKHPINMFLIGDNLSTSSCVPYLHRIISTARG